MATPMVDGVHDFSNVSHRRRPGDSRGADGTEFRWSRGGYLLDSRIARARIPRLSYKAGRGVSRSRLAGTALVTGALWVWMLFCLFWVL